MLLSFANLRQKITLKIFLKGVCGLILCVVMGIAALDLGISWLVKDRIYNDLNTLPSRQYGLVLGTSKYVARNTPNQFYRYRIQSAVALFEQQKVHTLLLSGDNRTVHYNEPRSMYIDLQKKGVPSSALYMDFAGFRTLDSIVRAKHVFQIEPFTIITQRFHCERALLIAKFHNVDAICFVADSPKTFLKTRLRETLARVKAVWDLLSQKQPHFLGNPEPIPTKSILEQ